MKDLTHRKPTPSEASITDHIVRSLRRRGYYVRKIQGGPMQRAGLPDLWVVVEGRLFCFEVKRKGGYATKLQLAEIEKIRKAGAVAEVVRSLEEVEEILGKEPTNEN